MLARGQSPLVFRGACLLAVPLSASPLSVFVLLRSHALYVHIDPGSDMCATKIIFLSAVRPCTAFLLSE